MQLCSTFLLILALAVGPAAANNTATLWDQALQHHGWSTVHNRETPDNQCHHMQAASTNMELQNTGFHGKITYTVDLPQHMGFDSHKFTVLQLLPAGLYADPYELQNLVTTTMQRGDSKLLSSFKVFGLIDVEKIETECSQTVLSISAHYAACQTDDASCTAHMQMELTVPLHARYPAPQTFHAPGFKAFLWSGLHHYNITRPLFLVEDASESGAATPRCYSTPAQQISSSGQQFVYWTIPTGGMWHMQLVEIVTVLTAVCSLCILLKAIFQDSKTRMITF